MTTPRAWARTAGLLYLIVAAGGAFNELYVRPRIVTSGNVLESIRASTTLVHAGAVSELVAAVCWLLTAMALYVLLRHVDPMIAGAMVVLVAVGVAISCAGVHDQYAAMTIATGEEYSRSFGGAGAGALIRVRLDAYDGALINALFFGLWLLPLGFLVIRSGFIPKALGVLLFVGGSAYLAHLVTDFVTTGLGTTFGLLLTAVGGIMELVFVGWLLVRGGSVPARAMPDAG
jgi:Domain of unknown function (DUF4386)